MVPEPGARVSHYRLIRRLGTGGMGDVYLAHDDKLDRSVAIKFLIGNSDERARKRLLTEARAVAALDHPNICSIHEIDADQWLGDFIVMQYVEGETLNGRLQRGRMLPGEALGVCGRIADALRAAHARGIIHRDLKPQNVILTTSGDPKLLDFGLAKNISSTAKAAAAPTETQLTKPHAVLGTAGYMSPEQVRSHPADHRSDLFALGCLLYECLTGKRAFTGGTSADIHADVLHREPPPPSTLVPELDASHDALVARLLEKDPAQRFQSAEEALGAMRVLEPSRRSNTDGGSHVDPDPPPPRSRARTMAIVAAIAVAAIAIVLWQGPWFRRLPEAPPDAAGWYNKGVEAIREGRFWTAKTNLDEAVSLFPKYALAHLRLAEAQSELDDASGASLSVNRAADAIPSWTRLTREQDYRVLAIRSSVLRKHDQAVQAYKNLVRMNESAAAAWLDLGRAQEAAGQRSDALGSYRKALTLDSQYAAAHLRLGNLQVQMLNVDDGTAQFNEAIRLYETAGQTEGMVEALVRKADALVNTGRNTEVREALDRAVPLIGPSDAFHRVRSKFAIARLTAVEGKYPEAEAMSRATVEEATAAGLQSTASSGLTDLGYTLSVRRAWAEADAVFQRAIELAIRHQVKRAEMRGRLQQASSLYARGDYQEAIVASAEPLKFYAEQHFPRPEADGKNILARAYESLENYKEAARLSAELIALADAMNDRALKAAALDSIAGQLANQGRLTEALERRQQLEAINREQKNNIALPLDLTNRAELLIRLGRGADAETALEEITQRAGEGIPSFKARDRRVAMLRAMRANTERRWQDVEQFAKFAIAMKDPKAPPDVTARWALVLQEHARAQRGVSNASIDTIVAWHQNASVSATRREIAYWIAQTLLARGERERASQLLASVAAEPGAAGNTELHWRLAALAAIAGTIGTPPAAESASIRDAFREIQALTAAWPSHATAYFARPDLAVLRQRLQ